jgi:hypothetical protein
VKPKYGRGPAAVLRPRAAPAAGRRVSQPHMVKRRATGEGALDGASPHRRRSRTPQTGSMVLRSALVAFKLCLMVLHSAHGDPAAISARLDGDGPCCSCCSWRSIVVLQQQARLLQPLKAQATTNSADWPSGQIMDCVQPHPSQAGLRVLHSPHVAGQCSTCLCARQQYASAQGARPASAAGLPPKQHAGAERSRARVPGHRGPNSAALQQGPDSDALIAS